MNLLSTRKKTALILLCGAAFGAQAAKLDQSLQVVGDTHRSAEKSQQRVDQLAMQQQKLLEEYRRLNNSLEYQQAYTRELEQLQASREQQIAALTQQIDDARITHDRPLRQSQQQPPPRAPLPRHQGIHQSH